MILGETERRKWKMKLKEIRVLMLTLIIASTVGVVFNVVPVLATETLYISSHFTFTEDIYEPVCVMADDIVINGNGFALQGSGAHAFGFHLNGRSNVTIKNVTVKGWAWDGIYLYESSNNSIYGNNVTNNGEGIELYESSNNSIYGNNLTENNYNGIKLWNSSNNNIYGNNIKANNYTYGGIKLELSSKNSIYGNNITDNGYGICLGGYSNNNDIHGNSVTANIYHGIWLYGSSSSNAIYHNNFVDNGVHAYDDNPANSNWHHPDLLEGNYWSNYTGVDDGSGTGKHAIAGDGIGDTDIPWPGPDYDNYPFTHESGWMIITATVDIDPDTLNLKSNGAFVTAYVELPDGYNVADIALDTVCLDGIQAITDPQYDFVTDPNAYLVDHDGDGILERMVKFDRDTVRDALTGMPDCEEGNKFYDLPLIVTGKVAGILFEGTDTILVLKK